jgi:hypothetical protein
MSDDKKVTVPEVEPTEGPQRVGGFPTVSLQKAIGMMQKVWEKEKRNPALATTIVGHWGYSPKSSGGFQALASLKRFGLLEEVPGGTKRNLKVSQMALDLMKYETTDLDAYRKQLKFMALLPELHEEVWKKYGVEMPSDKTLESYLVFDRHFTEETAKQFIGLYKETISFAKLGENDTVGELNAPTGGNVANKGQENSSNVFKHQMDTTINPGQLPIPIAGKVALIPFPMSEDDFDLFVGTLQLWKKKLVQKPAPVAPAVSLPCNAVWKNDNHDKPVKLVALMGEREGELYYQSDDGTGIPASQLKF